MVEYLVQKSPVNVADLDVMIRAQFGAAVSGISGGPGKMRVHFVSEPTVQQQADAAAILAGHGTLVLTADKAQISADGVDTVKVSWIGSLSDVFDYTISTEGGSTSGTDNALPFEINFSTNDAGTYVFKVQKQGTFETGYITVEAV